MKTVFLIDQDARRRAEVSGLLIASGRHVEPFETVDEFMAFEPDDGMALIHDSNGAAEQLGSRTASLLSAIPIMAFSESIDLERVVRALQAGAVSYLAWPFAASTFDKELDRLAPRIRQATDRRRRQVEARARLASLTQREREVLVALISEGTTKSIARSLDISPRTVEKYRAAIIARLGVENTAQAVRVGVVAGVFDNEPLAIEEAPLMLAQEA